VLFVAVVFPLRSPSARYTVNGIDCNTRETGLLTLSYNYSKGYAQYVLGNTTRINSAADPTLTITAHYSTIPYHQLLRNIYDSVPINSRAIS